MESYKIATLNNIAQVGTDALGPNFQLVEDEQQAHALLVRSANLHDMEFSPQVLAIGRAGAGVNNIPLERCAEKGIVVFNTPGANANAVKEMTIAAMLLAARDIVGGIEWVNENSDDPEISKKAEKAKKQFAGSELRGKKLGVIGLGSIGTMVANIGRRMGMEVYGYDPYLSIKAALSLDSHVRHVDNVDDIYSTCDYISIHVPANDKTKGMVDADAIRKMKENVVVLNYARDSLVDERAMSEALQEGRVAHYMTDFANSVSTQMKHATVTPHLGASTKEAEDNCAIMASRELRDYLENGNIVNSVNFPDVDLGPISTPMRLALFHLNVPHMIGKITSILSDADANIENMSNRSAGEYAYTLIELSAEVEDSYVEQLAALDDLIRVRAIRA